MNEQKLIKKFKEEIGLPLPSILNNKVTICFYNEKKDGKDQLFFDYWFTTIDDHKKKDGYLFVKTQCPDVSKIPRNASMSPAMKAIYFVGIAWARISPEAICSPDKPIEHTENIISLKWFSIKQFKKEMAGKKEDYTNLGECTIFSGDLG